MNDDLTHRIAVQVHEDFKQRLIANSPHFDGVLDDLPNLLSEVEINVAHTLRAIEAIGLLVLDEWDQAVYAEAFVLAEAVRRFLARVTTQRVIDAGLLDDDVVRDLVDSADRMWTIRTQRVGSARSAPVVPPEEKP